jgi:nitrogen-specific signal transduction histidine kinase
MQVVTTVGLDIAKSVFQVHGVDTAGQVVIRRQLKHKLFNPFFTTKPAGEGTGLGLSISHDIIVKQHGGSIEVDTQPGEFTEFRIILPRTAASIAKSGERA